MGPTPGDDPEDVALILIRIKGEQEEIDTTIRTLH
jgi:hypothetical protein